MCSQFFFLFERSSLRSATAQVNSTEKTSTWTGKLFSCKCLTPSPPLFLLPPALCLFLLYPSMLFVLGTYQPERKKRSGGGGVSQHVKRWRGEKRERIACGQGTEKADCWQKTERKEDFFFFFIWSHYSLVFIKLCVKVQLDASCHKTKPTGRKRQERGQGITMVGWRRRK